MTFTPTINTQEALSIKLQKLTARSDLNDREFIELLSVIEAYKDNAVREAQAEQLKDILNAQVLKPEYHNGFVGKYQELKRETKS